MNIEHLLQATKPILFETNDEESPYGLCGTCYPVKYKNDLFIVSAFHCYDNFEVDPKNTLYPRPEDPNSFFAFDKKVRAKAVQSKDKKHDDQIFLRVAKSHHSDSEIDKVIALDLADSFNSQLPTSNEIKDIRVRGYPFGCPNYKIDYDRNKIHQQAYTTNGILSVNKASYDFCYYIEMITPIPVGMSPNGMSGSPIYGITQSQKPVYCGTIIEFSTTSGEYLVIGPEVLVNALREFQADTSNY